MQVKIQLIFTLPEVCLDNCKSPAEFRRCPIHSAECVTNFWYKQKYHYLYSSKF